jgi:hypothetical protein
MPVATLEVLIVDDEEIVCAWRARDRAGAEAGRAGNATLARGSGSAQWERVNRVRSGRKQR